MTARWSIGFFFALVAFPFVAVWTITQGPKTLDRLFPIYQVVKIDSVTETPTGLALKNVQFAKHHACTPNGALYVSSNYSDGAIQSEVLIPAERGALGTPLIVKPIMRPGDTFTVPEIRIVASRDLLAKVDGLRFVIPCERPFVGDTKAYTNIVLLR
jgi:hypothetical protein